MATSIEIRRQLRAEGKKATPSAIKAKRRELEATPPSQAIPRTQATVQALAARDSEYSETLARQLFNYAAPGEDWNRNRASYLALAQRVLSGEQTQIGGEPVAPFLQQYQQSGGASSAAGGIPTNTQAALDVINNSDLPNDIKLLFRNVVNIWDPATEINTENVIRKFKELQSSTIDPYFQQLSKLAIDDITKARDFGIQQRSLELEPEKMKAEQNIKGTQADLEARGMTFSGEAVQRLGGKSAYPQSVEGGIPFQQLPFGGTPIEGDVIAANRLMSTSSQARYQKGLEDLQRQAEKYLGTTGATGLFPRVTPVGGITGGLEQDKQGAYAGALSSLAGQERQNVAARQPISFNFGQ